MVRGFEVKIGDSSEDELELLATLTLGTDTLGVRKCLSEDVLSLRIGVGAAF